MECVVVPLRVYHIKRALNSNFQNLSVKIQLYRINETFFSRKSAYTAEKSDLSFLCPIHLRYCSTVAYCL